MHKPTLTALALSLTLTGCTAAPETTEAETTAAGTVAETPPPTAEQTQEADATMWAFDYYNGHGQFELPTDTPTNEWAQEVNQYREDAGLDDTLYWTTIEADNTNGLEKFNIQGLTFITPEGGQVFSIDHLDDLISEAQDIDNTDQYNHGIDLMNANNEPTHPGAKGEIPIAFTEQATPERVYVSGPKAQGLEAYPLP